MKYYKLIIVMPALLSAAIALPSYADSGTGPTMSLAYCVNLTTPTTDPAVYTFSTTNVNCAVIFPSINVVLHVPAGTQGVVCARNDNTQFKKYGGLNGQCHQNGRTYMDVSFTGPDGQAASTTCREAYKHWGDKYITTSNNFCVSGYTDSNNIVAAPCTNKPGTQVAINDKSGNDFKWALVYNQDLPNSKA